jgi:hypothetical protein
MPTFSRKSLKNLEGVHPDLVTLFSEVILHRDCTIVSGIRTEEEQQALYAKGRTEAGDIVTWKDGIERRSKHQTGNALDVVPYPEMWDEAALTEFGKIGNGKTNHTGRYETRPNHPPVRLPMHGGHHPRL